MAAEEHVCTGTADSHLTSSCPWMFLLICGGSCVFSESNISFWFVPPPLFFFCPLWSYKRMHFLFTHDHPHTFLFISISLFFNYLSSSSYGQSKISPRLMGPTYSDLYCVFVPPVKANAETIFSAFSVQPCTVCPFLHECLPIRNEYESAYYIHCRGFHSRHCICVVMKHFLNRSGADVAFRLHSNTEWPSWHSELIMTGRRPN